MSAATAIRPFADDQGGGPLRKPSMGGTRRSILAGIEDTSAAWNRTEPDSRDVSFPAAPISNTDAVLRQRRSSQTSSTKNSNGSIRENGSVGRRKSTSLNSPPSSIQGSPSKPLRRRNTQQQQHSPPNELSNDDPHSSPHELGAPLKNRHRGSSASSHQLRHSASNLSQQSRQDDSHSIASSRRSSKGTLSNLLRRRSRTQSQGHLDSAGVLDLAAEQQDSPISTPGRIRSFSGSARKMSLKMPFNKRSQSSSSLDIRGVHQNGGAPHPTSITDPDYYSAPPPVPAVPSEHLRNGASPQPSHHFSNGYKPVQAQALQSEDGSRSRRFSKPSTPAAAEISSSPFGAADDALARARSRSGASATDSPKSSQGRSRALSNGRPRAVASNIFAGGAGPLEDGDVRAAAEDAAGGYGARSQVKASPRSPASQQEPKFDKAWEEAKEREEEDDEDDDNDDGDYESSDEEFHDAILADIVEGSEEEEDPHAVGGRGRSFSGPAVDRTATTTSNGQITKPRGTAGASRRAGSSPTRSSRTSYSVTNTPTDAKAKQALPSEITEKAARVARLSYDDVKQDTADLRQDIATAKKALDLFLNSRMIEAEEIIKVHADKKLYYALGYALIATIKGFMTFEPIDLAIAISLCKDALAIASLLRKPTNTVANFGRFVRGTGQSPQSLASMTQIQKHAELVHAEALLLKAVLGIVYSGDFFGFVSEALNMRNAYGIYRSLSKFVEWADAKAGSLPGDIDNDFRSGVFLGNGLISMILGLLPGKVLKIMEVFGYTGDTAWALETLRKAGDWSADPKDRLPGMDKGKEGIRRQMCDMSLLMYHLVISTFIPVNGVDINFADKVLHYNLKRYPQGVFFLYFSGRLYSTQALSERAVKQFEAARDVQKEYVQLKHICIWDLSLCYMSMCKWKQAHECFDILAEENNWSKAVYNYGRAANLYESAAGQDEASMEEAGDIFRIVPGLTQKIAGKSIPMEKFVARKANKFIQYNRLLLPGLEFSYIYHCMSNAPRYILADEALVLVSDALADLHEVSDPADYFSGKEYYDDLCLAHFLRAVCLKFIAHPEAHSKPTAVSIPVEEAEEQAEFSLRHVIENGKNIQEEHWLIYFARYELACLLGKIPGRRAEARELLESVLSGKKLDDKNRKGKYSMQNMCLLRSNAVLRMISDRP